MSDLLWFVAHTRPRCEKKLVQYCDREKLATTLPCYNAIHEYRGKTAVFLKPLFPGYVFLQLLPSQRQKVYQNDYVANLFEVDDQDLFFRQLEGVLRALETNLEVWPAPEVGEGKRVRMVRGPL